MAPLAPTSPIKRLQTTYRGHTSVLRGNTRPFNHTPLFIHVHVHIQETTLLRLQGVIDRIEARLAGRSLNEYEPSLTESQFSSLESFTSEYSRASVSRQDDARCMPDLQHADRFLEVI